MRIVPNSTISIYSGVEIDNDEQLVFSSLAGQNAYFVSKRVLAEVPCTVVRKTGALRVEVSAASILNGCNYISFINPSFENKTIYARIIDYDYINNECVEITYAIDYWQTWMFDVQFEDAYIEREHLSEEDWNKAEQNPYDPTIYEFRTDENLVTSRDLEKLNYTLSGQSNNDGLKLALASHSVTSATDTLGVLIKMAYIDLKKIDDQWIEEHPNWNPSAPGALTQLPSWNFVTYLQDIVSYAFGFFYLSRPTYTYLSGRYGTSYPFTGRSELGSGWTGANLSPFQESSFEPPLTYIYDAYGASADTVGSARSHMGDFFELILNYETEAQTSNTIVDLSIIPNDMMTFAGDVVSAGTPFSAGIQPAQAVSVESKKLMRFPFCYARIISPGDIKELKYEKFADLQSGGTTAYVYITMDLTDKPTVIVAPKQYKVTGMSKASNVDTNVEEGLYFSQFPTLPYNIDAWTAQCAAVTNDLIASRTTEAGYELNKNSEQYTSIQGKISQMLNPVSEGVGTVGKGVSMGGEYGGAAALGGAIMTMGLGYDMMKWDEQKQLAQNRLWKEGASSMGNITGGEVATQLRLTKAAYAADHYYPSDGVGATNFNYLAYCDIILMNVSLNADVLAVYDNFFKHYGYTSGRCGIPRVCNYVAGSSVDSEVPHWITLNGKSTTYVKTMDCKLSHAMLPVANTIRDMFNSGVRMIKGD